MTQVSRRRLRPDVEKRIYELFWESLAKTTRKKEIEVFLSDLLTHTEKIMLAKRLAIAVLLQKEFSYESIMEILKVSNTTVAGVQEQLSYGRGGYSGVAQRLAKEDAWGEFADFLNQLFPRYSRRPVPDRVFRRKTPL